MSTELAIIISLFIGCLIVVNICVFQSMDSKKLDGIRRSIDELKDNDDKIAIDQLTDYEHLNNVINIVSKRLDELEKRCDDLNKRCDHIQRRIISN